MFHGFTTATAPHHPCWQELTLVLCSIIHHSHNTPSVLARTPPSTKSLDAAPERSIRWQGTLANTRIHGCTTSAVLAKTLATTRIHRCSTTRAPHHHCWQGLQPSLGSMDSPQPQHPISPAGKESSQHSDPSMHHNQSTSSCPAGKDSSQDPWLPQQQGPIIHASKNSSQH
jgi:hypothetical protein